MDKITTSLFGVVAILALPAQSPAAETLEWLTDNQPSHNGKEERLQLRSAPRTTYGYTVPRSAELKARAFNAEYGALNARWAVPVWMQVQYVGPVTAADTTISCNTQDFEFRDASLALVYQTNNLWALVEVDSVTPGLLTLLDPVGTEFSAAYVMPVRVGRLRGGVSYARAGYSETAELNFVVEDNEELTVTAPAQFLSNDIYYDEQLMGDAGTYTASVVNREDLADYGLGKTDAQTPWLYNQYQQAFMRLLDNSADTQAFREWLYRRAGKYRAFWMPSFENDMRKANTGTVVSSLRWHRDGYDNWQNRLHIAIELADGSWLPRTLSAVSTFDSNTMQGTLSSPLNVSVSDIRRISYLGLKRLVSDTVRLQWIGNSVVQVNYSVLELSP